MKNTFNKLFERIASIMFALTLVFDYFPEIGISYNLITARSFITAAMETGITSNSFVNVLINFNTKKGAAKIFFCRTLFCIEKNLRQFFIIIF